MVEGTFGADGKLEKTGPSGVTAEGLGAVNIKGVDDKKTSADPEADSGRKIVNENVTSGTIPRVGTDPASTQVTTIEQPESGRTNQGQGSTTASGREDYINLAGQGAK